MALATRICSSTSATLPVVRSVELAEGAGGEVAVVVWYLAGSCNVLPGMLATHTCNIHSRQKAPTPSQPHNRLAKAAAGGLPGGSPQQLIAWVLLRT
jgi:hypothetical protein